MARKVSGWAFGALLLAIGAANLWLVHPVPAVAYGLVALVYLPPVDSLLKSRLGLSLPPGPKVVLGIAIVAFTLGVSDLGDMID